MASHQVLHDRDRLDHRDVAVLYGRYEAGRVDGEELRVVLDAGQQVHSPQLVRKLHLFQQPDDPKSPPLAKYGDHVCDSLRKGWVVRLNVGGSRRADETLVALKA